MIQNLALCMYPPSELNWTESYIMLYIAMVGDCPPEMILVVQDVPAFLSEVLPLQSRAFSHSSLLLRGQASSWARAKFQSVSEAVLPTIERSDDQPVVLHDEFTVELELVGIPSYAWDSRIQYQAPLYLLLH